MKEVRTETKKRQNTFSLYETRKPLLVKVKISESSKTNLGLFSEEPILEVKCNGSVSYSK